MAKEYKLEVEKRDSTKKSDLKKYRRDGKIPGIYYSYDSKKSINFLVTQAEINAALKSDANIFSINVGGENKNVLFKSVQYHPVTDQMIHIDLYGVNMKKAVIVRVPLQIMGDAIGVKEEGGVLNQVSQDIEVKCLPMNIPNFINVDISSLSIGDTMSAAELSFDDSLELISPEDMLIISVTTPMKEVQPETEADLGQDEEEEAIEDKADSPSDDSKTEDNENKS